MLKVVYENKAVGVSGNVTNTATEQKDFAKLNNLDEDILIENFATLEKNHWLLTDKFMLMPDDLTDVGVGYWSEQLSNINGEFATPIQITRTYNGQFTSPAISITFDTYNDVYATDINVKWYRNDELLYDLDFEPNASVYSCEQNAIAYNKVVITFNKLNKADRYLKIFKIDDGIIRNFYKDEIIGLTINESVSDTGNELKINTMNLDILSKSPIKIIFQRVQALKVYKDEKLYGTFFVDTSERELNKYNLMTYDLVGMLDNQTFYGDIYNNKNSAELVAEICDTLPYELDESLQNIPITGYLQNGTARNALMQVAFVLNAYIDTSRADKILIKPMPTYESESIIIDDTRAGVEFKETTEAPVTKIELIAHKYVQTSNSEEIYNDILNGTLIATFSMPHYNYSISGGTIIESGANYVKFSGTGNNVTLNSYTYEDQTSQYISYNPTNTENSLPNVRKFESATLVNQANAHNVISKLENALYTNSTINVSFLLDSEQVGDYITINTEDGVKVGQLLEIDYDLSNDVIYANCKIREVINDR